MSSINKAKTTMSNGLFQQQGAEELLIPIKFLTKKEINLEKEHSEYEKLKHNLKKKITENIMDNLAKVVAENENKKDIHVFAALKTKSDSRGLYRILKKINQRMNEPHKVKDCFINWFYKTPNAVDKRKRNKISKNNRNIKLNHYYYHYQNNLIPNIATTYTDMTSRKKKPVQPSKIEKLSPKYKYNYSSNNSNVSYNKFEYGGTDTNKGNIYIGKKNGDASYYHQKKYNNFGSLTIIQHNVDNTKKNNYKNYYRYTRDMEMTRATNKSQERRNPFTVGSSTIRNSNSSSMIFCNSYGGSKPIKVGENTDTNDLKKEIPADRQKKKIWTVRKETYECKEIF